MPWARLLELAVKLVGLILMFKKKPADVIKEEKKKADEEISTADRTGRPG